MKEETRFGSLSFGPQMKATTCRLCAAKHPETDPPGSGMSLPGRLLSFGRQPTLRLTAANDTLQTKSRVREWRPSYFEADVQSYRRHPRAVFTVRRNHTVVTGVCGRGQQADQGDDSRFGLQRIQEDPEPPSSDRITIANRFVSGRQYREGANAWTAVAFPESQAETTV